MIDNVSLHPASDAPTVLIVDDNCLSRKMLRDMLQVFGYRTILCDSGGGGLAMIRAHRPDVIVMDLNLPGIAGLEVTRWVRQDARLRSTPIIAVTAYAREESEQKALKAGCDAYLPKPLALDKLIRTVESFIPRDVPAVA